MPELAEAALMAREMSEATRKRPLRRMIFAGDRPFLRKIVPPPVQKAWRSFLDHPLEISSLGKRVYFGVQGSERRIGVHLGMSGRFGAGGPSPERRRHGFLILEWDGARFHYSDYRRFSRMKLSEGPMNHAIGGWDPKRGLHFNPATELKRTVAEVLGNFRRKPRISWLLDHGKITGVGNYMANDALGRLDLSPFEPAASLEEAVRILRECQKVAALIFRRRGELAGNLGFYEAGKVPRILYRGRPLYTRFKLPR
ncbi:MAG TPA: DNA-formamidopyrimidine glycosylase family protein [bacterium]|nr:DNA-formamidopyrimidine glycosylase family protein [bacterium]